MDKVRNHLDWRVYGIVLDGGGRNPCRRGESSGLERVIVRIGGDKESSGLERDGIVRIGGGKESSGLERDGIVRVGGSKESFGLEGVRDSPGLRGKESSRLEGARNCLG